MDKIIVEIFSMTESQKSQSYDPLTIFSILGKEVIFITIKLMTLAQKSD